MTSVSTLASRHVCAVLISAVTSLACHADADEAWLLRAPLPADVKPLLTLIVDTSAAMAPAIAVDESYDPLSDYGADLPAPMRCEPARVYWRRSAGPAPDCTMQSGLAPAPPGPANGLHCEAARAPLALHGFFVASRAAQWRANGRYWSALRPESVEAVECRADRGRHGATTGAWFASDGPQGPWRDDAGGEIAWDRSPLADPYIFYTGNYLNYLRSVRAPVDLSMAEAMLRPLSAALAATEELEVALVHVDRDGPEGGYVARAPVASDIAAAELRDLADETPSGSAPLGETLAEAAAWLSGGAIRFGTDPRADGAAADPVAPGRYRSPFVHACRPVSLAFLTAGAPSDDELAAVAAGALPRFDELSGGCGACCLPALEQWIETADLRDDLAGAQNAPLTWLAPAPAPAADPLAYVNLIARSFQRDAAVPASPQLSAAGMTLSAGGSTEPGIVFGLTAPLARQRWAGNLFRYALRAPATPLAPPTIVDRDAQPAIDPATGLPMASSQSLWSDSPDANLLAGGAAGRLPAADARHIYSDIVGNRILDPANRLAPGNVRLDRVTVGLAATDPESLEEVLAWPAAQRTLGDRGAHSPGVVDYPESSRQLVFAVTHDGLLQAFDADSGVEVWAWMPQELLHRLPQLMRDESTTARRHGIDGPLVLHRHDPDGNGRVDAGDGEHLWLLFGLGRGGNRYYALDISSADDPVLLWSIETPGDRDVESRAEPVVTRLAVDGSAQSSDDWVVLLAGGYDRRFDSLQATGAGAGNSLRVLDAVTGELLWSGGGDDDDDLRIAGLASLPSAPRALDLDGDGYIDRAYVADVAGGLWRLDFTSGVPADELAEARMIARLGTGEHRFYATPDSSVARVGNGSVIAIAVGSGWLSGPRDASVVDRIYTIFDRDTPGDTSVLTEPDLHDATDTNGAMPPTAPGWYARLDKHGPGEKVVGPTVTFDHALRFQTYQPIPNDESEPCGPPRALLRLHSLDVRSGLPHATAVESEDDEPEDIAGSGLPIGLRFGFPDRWEEACTGCRPRPFGVAGTETFDTGYAGDPVKTSWRKLSPPPASP